MDPKTQDIIKALETKASAKQFIYRKTIDIFETIKNEVHSVAREVGEEMQKIDSTVEVSSKDSGKYECELKFSGDTLMFLMHTNVFNFPPEHTIHKTEYVREDPMRAYCGMIMIYDFLSDSIK